MPDSGVVFYSIIVFGPKACDSPAQANGAAGLGCRITALQAEAPNLLMEMS
jgi:hypothetical protein